MQVEITEEKLKDGDPETGMHYSLGKGDIITVSDNTGKRWCGYGWAKDAAGVHPTGERIPGAREVLDVAALDLVAGEIVKREALNVHNATLGGGN